MRFFKPSLVAFARSRKVFGFVLGMVIAVCTGSAVQAQHHCHIGHHGFNHGLGYWHTPVTWGGNYWGGCGGYPLGFANYRSYYASSFYGPVGFGYYSAFPGVAYYRHGCWPRYRYGYTRGVNYYAPAVVVASPTWVTSNVSPAPRQLPAMSFANSSLQDRLDATRAIVSQLQNRTPSAVAADGLRMPNTNLQVNGSALERADRAFARGEYWLAVHDYKQAGRDGEQPGVAALRLGIAELACQMFDEAAKSFRYAHTQGVTLTPDNLPGGSLAAMYGDYPGNAKEHLELIAKGALQQRDNLPELWTVGVMLRLQGDVERSETFLAQVALKPSAFQLAASELQVGKTADTTKVAMSSK